MPREIHDRSFLEAALAERRQRSETVDALLRDASHRLGLEEAARARGIAAPAVRVERLSQGWRMVMAGAAAALVILATGLALRIALGAEAPDLASAVSPAPEAAPAGGSSEPPLSLPAGFGLPPGREDIVVTDYVLFTEATQRAAGIDFLVEAGHRFETERDSTFSSAWCYTRHAVDGVEVTLDLGSLLPDGEVLALPVDAGAAALGLAPEDVEALRDACPWLERKAASALPVPSRYSFEGDVTGESVDRLIAAVRGGARDISFRSPGGDLGAALRGFDALWRSEVTTRATGPCASACVLLFAAGRERLVEPGGAIGVHRWQSAEGEGADEAEAQLLTAEILERLLRAGIAADLHVAASRVPATELWLLSEHDLTAWKVVTTDAAETVSRLD